MTENYDVVVIGSGPGGYTAAVRAANEGARVALVERGEVGGLCLNWGCIPSKILLKHALSVKQMKTLVTHGIIDGKLTVDFEQLIKYSRERVETIRASLTSLINASGVEIIAGDAKLEPNGIVSVQTEGKTRNLGARRGVLIATGARPRNLDGYLVDGETVITSREALALNTLPKQLTIIGGGVIGCEMATFFAALGSQVTILEYMDQLLPGFDADISTALTRSFKKRGIKVFTKTSAKLLKTEQGSTLVLNGSKETQLSADKVLVAVGVVPNSDLAGDLLERERGFIVVDSHTYKTNRDGIYAIGDVIQIRHSAPHPCLAHVASAEAELAIEHILLNEAKRPRPDHSIDYANIPFAVFTDPEIGTVGMTEEAARKEYPDHNIVSQSVSDKVMGIAIALEQTEGTTKLIIDETRHGKILGAHIIGSAATERIHILVEARRSEDSAHLMQNQMLAHPTFAETIHEALLAYDGRAVHVPLKMQRRKNQ